MPPALFLVDPAPNSPHVLSLLLFVSMVPDSPDELILSLLALPFLAASRSTSAPCIASALLVDFEVKMNPPRLIRVVLPMLSSHAIGRKRLRRGPSVTTEEQIMPRFTSTTPRMALGALSHELSADVVARRMARTRRMPAIHPLYRISVSRGIREISASRVRVR